MPAASGASAKKTPALVAMPLPPLNFSQQVKLWPSTAAMPAKNPVKFRVRRWTPQKCQHPVTKPGAGGVAFQSINDERKYSRRFADHAKNIGRADVAAANGANVNPLRARDQIAGRDRAQQIRRHGDDDVNEHGGTL